MSNTIDKYLESSFWQSKEVVQFPERNIALAEVALPDGAVIFKTSGSSGTQKWVVHTRESLLYSARQVIEHLSITSADIWFLALPIHHVGGFGILARAYASGCGISHFFQKWDVVRAVESMKNDRVTLCSLVPTQLVDIVRAQLICPGSIRAVIVGGGKLELQIKQRAIDLGWPILESYGMTETGSQIATQLVPDESEITLIKGWNVSQSPEGALMIKGPGLLFGYLIERDSVLKFDDPKSEDGWFTTTDIVDLNKRSNSLIFRSRNDRVVKILGELVSLDKLESDLAQASGVIVLVVDIPDERKGVSLVPVIELNDQMKLDPDLLQLSGIYKLKPPVFIESFPRNSMGKLDRRRLRESVVFLAE